MKKVLPPEKVALIQSTGNAIREAWLAGDLETAEKLILERWRVIPPPAEDYDFGQILSCRIVTFYRDTHQFKKAIQWLDTVRAAYDDPAGENAHVKFLSGTVYHASSQLDLAFAAFDDLYERFKKRPFQGEKPEYLAFYMEERKRRKKG